jgi:phosphotransferase system IIB component
VANTLLGKTENDAIQIIEGNGFTWVVVDRDGEEFITDASYQPTRIRLTIRKGVVYDAIAG